MKSKGDPVSVCIAEDVNGQLALRPEPQVQGQARDLWGARSLRAL